ncbi:MAG: BON domain-containing protein [Maricaulaceae bacterium]
MKKLTLISALAISLSLSACAVTTAGVKPGDERNLSRSINDISIERVIEARLKRADGYDLSKVDVEVAEGIVVLAGRVPTPEDSIEAERIAWSAPHVDEIGNEIMVGAEGRSILRGTKDGVLGSSVRTRLIADKTVKARNINIEARNGIVYLLGVARSPEELERIAYIASTTRGTREVVSYIKIHDGVSAAPPQDYAGANAIPYAPDVNTTIAPQRALPDFLSETPQGLAVDGLATQGLAAATAPTIDPLAPYYRDPLTGERIDLDPTTGTIPFQAPQASAIAKIAPGLQAPTEFPSDDELGRYRVGTPGEAVSVIESAPYYIDPVTGKQIPVNWVR